ncbi:MAG: hypothetical protein Q9222_003957 [Ikaeria aurantiellina]
MAPPISFRSSALVLLAATLITLTLAATDSTCYFPNGTAAIDPDYPYLPCNPNTKNSMCCRTTTTDSCTSDGLCLSGYDGNLWRDFCTDPTWQAPNCAKLCLNSGNVDSHGKACFSITHDDQAGVLTSWTTGQSGGSVQVTRCLDGSYCCGVGTKANNCCSNGGGVWIGKNGHTTNVNPTATSIGHSAAATSSSSASSSAIPTIATTSTTDPTTIPGAVAATQTSSGPPAAVTTSSSKSSSNTGAIAGGVVGGVVAAAIIIIGGIWLLRRRRNAPVEEKEKAPNHWGFFAPTKPQMFSEVEGSNATVELPARERHEMESPSSNPRQQHIQELP